VGAKAVQVASTLYRNGSEHIRRMLTELEEWMRRQEFESIERFRGKLSQEKSEDPSLFERVQFMKYYGGGQDTV
jgi:dihydroorotate dehydrogenase (fumarate)